MITLRKPRESDIEARQRLARHPGVTRGMGVHISAFQKITRQESKTWVQEIANHPNAWVIDLDGLIGRVLLDNVNQEDKCEGVERETALVDGEFVDDIIMGILDRVFVG